MLQLFTFVSPCSETRLTSIICVILLQLFADRMKRTKNEKTQEQKKKTNKKQNREIDITNLLSSNNGLQLKLLLIHVYIRSSFFFVLFIRYSFSSIEFLIIQIISIQKIQFISKRSYRSFHLGRFQVAPLGSGSRGIHCIVQPWSGEIKSVYDLF